VCQPIWSFGNRRHRSPDQEAPAIDDDTPTRENGVRPENVFPNSFDAPPALPRSKSVNYVAADDCGTIYNEKLVERARQKVTNRRRLRCATKVKLG
jgi:hypothetical protein